MDFLPSSPPCHPGVPGVAFLIHVCKVFFFSDCLSFPNVLCQALFICSLCPYLKRDFFFCPKVCICSLEIFCRGQRIRNRQGVIRGQASKGTEESDWIHTCTLPAPLRDRLQLPSLSVWLPEPAFRCVRLLGPRQRTAQTHPLPQPAMDKLLLCLLFRKTQAEDLGKPWLRLVLSWCSGP